MCFPRGPNAFLKRAMFVFKRVVEAPPHSRGSIFEEKDPNMSSVNSNINDARPSTTAIAKTIKAHCNVSFHVGHETLKASCFTAWINFIGFLIILSSNWQERRDSNPQPPVLETGALPIELHSYL